MSDLTLRWRCCGRVRTAGHVVAVSSVLLPKEGSQLVTCIVY